MRKAVVIFALGLAVWYGVAWLRGSPEPELSDEQRLEVEARVSAYSPVRTRTALFSPPLTGDASRSYARALELSEGHVPPMATSRPSTYIADLGASMPASLADALRSEELRRASDAIVEGARRPTMTLRPSLGEPTFEQYRLGRAALLLAIDDFRRGRTGSAVRRALAVQRYANDYLAQSLLSGALFTDLAREGARAVRAMVESGKLDTNALREVSSALDRLRRDAASPAVALLAESYLMDTLILAGPGGDSPLSGRGRIWADAIEEYDNDWLRGYVEINGSLQRAWQAAAGNGSFSAAGAEAAIGTCERLVGEKGRFCSSVVSMFISTAEAEIELREAQLAIASSRRL